MEDFKIRYCKLCLAAIHDENYVVIENVAKDMLNVLLLGLDFEDEYEYVVCSDCSTKWFTLQKFKSTCFQTDYAISSYVHDTTILPLDLREIFMKEKPRQHISDDIKICRLCMQPIRSISEFESINEEGFEKIQKFAPEMNIFIVKDPVMCETCSDSLAMHSDFLKKCSDMKQNIVDTSKGQVQDAHSLLPSLDISVKIEDFVEFEEDLPQLIKTECLDINCGDVKNESEIQDEEISTEVAAEYNRNDYSSVKMYKCQNCTFETRYKIALITHMLTHKDPSEVLMYKCENCDYESKYKIALERHMFKHKDPSEVPMYKCEHCNYATKIKGHFKTHLLIHQDPSEVLMYKCEHCDYKTKYKVNLERHMFKHKDPSEMQVYRCENCNYETKYQIALKSHVLRHKEIIVYKCGICMYGTNCKRNFKRHTLVHEDPSKLEMYYCATCNYKTIYKTHLKRHMLTHRAPSEVHMYKCEHCNFETKYKVALKRHMLKHKHRSEVQM